MQRSRCEDTRTPIERRVFRHTFGLIVVWVVEGPKKGLRGQTNPNPRVCKQLRLFSYKCPTGITRGWIPITDLGVCTSGTCYIEYARTALADCHKTPFRSHFRICRHTVWPLSGLCRRHPEFESQICACPLLAMSLAVCSEQYLCFPVPVWQSPKSPAAGRNLHRRPVEHDQLIGKSPFCHLRLFGLAGLLRTAFASSTAPTQLFVGFVSHCTNFWQQQSRLSLSQRLCWHLVYARD
jgi:hypothetical protein